MVSLSQERTKQRAPESYAASVQDTATLLGKVGWGMLASALAIWGLTTVLLLYGGASTNVGWILLAVYVTLIVGGLAILAASRPIERLLFKRQQSELEVAKSTTEGFCEHDWEQLLQPDTSLR